MATCHLCPPGDDWVPDFDVANHLRVVHPDVNDAPERWPDGQIVIHDLTLDPEDFERGDAGE
jgi:hypothetical protein